MLRLHRLPKWSVTNPKRPSRARSRSHSARLRRHGDVRPANRSARSQLNDVSVLPLVALMPLLMAHRARCLKDQPGTLQFDFLEPRDDKIKVLLIEVYQDEAAFNAHWDGASMATFRTQSEGMVAKMTGTRGTIAE